MAVWLHLLPAEQLAVQFAAGSGPSFIGWSYAMNHITPTWSDLGRIADVAKGYNAALRRLAVDLDSPRDGLVLRYQAFMERYPFARQDSLDEFSCYHPFGPAVEALARANFVAMATCDDTAKAHTVSWPSKEVQMPGDPGEWYIC